MTGEPLYAGFLRSAHAMPNRPALHVGGTTLAYEELLVRAKRIAATIQQHRKAASSTALTAVFGSRSVTAFAGTLGALLAGHGYVPLNPNFPTARTSRMLARAGCEAVVVDGAALPQLDEVLHEAASARVIILPDRREADAFAARWPERTFVVGDDLENDSQWSNCNPPPSATAYLLFTSGSTGDPKGVPVSHANVRHFVDTAVDRYGITPDDRFSQMFETTFDLSVFDMFAAWERGACVYCPSRATLLNPDRFIRDHELTVWFSVPSVGLLMQRLGALKPRRYPSLRWSLFCGEPLPVALAEAWSGAAPASTVENLYGPTELTVACTAYQWKAETSTAEAQDGIVPVGLPLCGMRARVVDEAMQDVAPGAVGELLMTGPQRTLGYWDDPAATRAAHVLLNGGDDIYYRTGDRVRAAVDDGPMTYVGRVDHQIKVFGHRVELGEIESALRREPGIDGAVALGWPLTSAGPTGVAAFVIGRGLDPVSLRTEMRKKLQAHAVPQTIEVLAEFPYNESGKVDRQALLRKLAG